MTTNVTNNDAHDHDDLAFDTPDAQEYAELMKLDAQEKAEEIRVQAAKNKSGRHAGAMFTVTAIEQPHRMAKRVFGTLSPLPAGKDGEVHPIDMDIWTQVNVACRLQLPILPDELADIAPKHGTASRGYSVCWYDVATKSIAFDVTLHDHDSPAMQWIAKVKPGDCIQLNAPHIYGAAISRDNRILVCDSTSLPAVRNIVTHTKVAGNTTIIFKGCAEELETLTALPAERTTIIQTDKPLDEAFNDINPDQYDAVWGGGEAREMRAIRSRCRKELALAKEDIDITGYWKAGQTIAQRDIKLLRVSKVAAKKGLSEAEILSRREAIT